MSEATHEWATPEAIAGRIARWHNQLRAVVLAGGTLVFSDQAWTFEPFAPDQAPLLDPDRIVFAIRDRDVTAGEVANWLTAYRAEQARAREQRDEQSAREAFEATARRDEREAQRGHRTGSANCESCGAYKPRPSAVCGQCGDDPVTWNGNRREFDRARGYA